MSFRITKKWGFYVTIGVCLVLKNKSHEPLVQTKWCNFQISDSKIKQHKGHRGIE